MRAQSRSTLSASATCVIFGAVLCASPLATVACTGRIMDASAPGGGAPGIPGAPGSTRPPRAPLYHCDETAALAAPELPLRRLTSTQLRNTLVQLVEGAAPSSHDAVLASLTSALDMLPADEPVRQSAQRHGGFRRLSQEVSQQQVEALYSVGTALGMALTSSSALRTEVFGACAADSDSSNDADCVRTFVRGFAERAFRRPVADEDVAFLASAADPLPITSEGLADVVALVVNSPELLYLPESGDESVATPGVVPLDPFELAAKLAYHFWNEPPDAELLDAARTGAILSDDEYRRQVDRLARDPRANAVLDEFFADWLQLDEVPQPDTLVGRPQFDAFAGDDVPTPELRQAMIDDVLAAARYDVRGGRSLSELLLERGAFAQNDVLASIYGTGRWDGASDPPIPPDVRVGLLTRPAFLVSGGAHTRPIMKGVFIRMGLMCETLPPPPANATAVLPAPSAVQTTRQAVESLTQIPGSQCAGCHATAINPLGFPTESFDALGRARTSERVLDEAGMLVADLPIDTHAVPNVVPGDPAEAAGAADLMRLIDESGRVHSCIAREYFRFTFQRVEDMSADGCSLATLEGAALEGRSLLEIFEASALVPAFREKRFE